MDRPVLAEAGESTGTEEAAERGAVESALTMKPNGAENWAGPASRRRDNIGAPAMQAFTEKGAEALSKMYEQTAWTGLRCLPVPVCGSQCDVYTNIAAAVAILCKSYPFTLSLRMYTTNRMSHFIAFVF